MNLRGDRNHKKRHDYRTFETLRPELTPVTRSDLPQIRAILAKWCEKRACAACGIGCERDMILRILNHWEDLPVRGLLCCIKGEPVGFRFSEQNGERLLQFVSKTASPHRGTALYMAVRMAEQANLSVVNAGPDMGIEGLAAFKSKFGPHEKLHKYSAIACT